MMLRLSVKKRCMGRTIPSISGLQGSIYSSRNIFVVRSQKGKPTLKKSKRSNDGGTFNNKEKLSEWVDSDFERKMKQQEVEYERRLKELKSLTASVARIIKKKEDIEKLQEIPMASEVNRDAEKIYGSLEVGKENSALLPENDPSLSGIEKQSELFNASNHSLITPAIDIPESITKRLGLAIKFLVSKTNINWTTVLQQLKEGGGFQGLPERDIRMFIYSIPKEQIRHLIPMLEQLLEGGNVKKSSKIINVFIAGLSHGGYLSDESIAQIEQYRNHLTKINKKGKLSRETYELMIQAYGKNNNLEKINMCLSEMKQNKLEPSQNTFSNILSTCVYKANDHKQAVEIFDSMKFLSQKTKPDTRAYQDIIVSYVNNDNIEKALDLYREMITEKIDINQRIMVALARGCTSRPELRFKAWDFIFDIYNNNWEPTLNTFEYMLYLSAKDGDVALSRAFYSKLNESNATTPRSFSFLLLAYSKSQVSQPDQSIELPPITFHEKGRNFRRNILSDVNLFPASAQNGIPFLPVLDLTSKEEIMAESSAMWAHTLMFNPLFVNTDCANTFLNIAAKMGRLNDFIDRYDSSTFLDRTGLSNDTRIIIEELPESISSNTDISQTDGESVSNVQSKFDEMSITKSPLLKYVGSNIGLGNRKISRTSLSYVIALKAAARFKNYKFAQRIWSERGTFRKTSNFRDLSRSTKDALDFQFANAMVSCLTKMSLLDDALAMLLSTEYQFKWTWKELRELYQAASDIDHSDACKSIRGIAKRAQIKYEGKIRRKDFKRYVMERGY